MRKLSHNKKRNLGLVYEFLTREVTRSAVSGDRTSGAKALAIVAKHLSEGTELYPELSLHRQVMATRGVSERLARRIVDELKAAGIRAASRRSLREQAKSELIHEINRSLGADLFDRFRISDYTAHASVSILMARGAGGPLDEGVELARVEDHLIEFLTSAGQQAPRYDADASLYAYRTAVGLFEQELGRELLPEQADLLREFIRTSLGGNPAPFERTFERQRTALREVLRARRADDVFVKDADMAKRLDEAIKDLESLTAAPDDESVERLMLYHTLQREIES